MPQWETILDKSSHISPIRKNPPKNYSTERLEILIKTKAASKTSLKSTSIKRKSTMPSKRISMRSIIILLLTFSSLAYLTAFIVCNTRKYSSNHPVCKRVYQLPPPYELYNKVIENNWIRFNKQKSREWLHQRMDNYFETAEPYISKIQKAYRWSETTNIKTAYRQTCTFARSIIYTPENQFRLVHYITPLWTYIKDIIHRYLIQLRHEMDGYIQSGSIESMRSNGDGNERGNNGLVEDKLKRTAKKILDYIDQINKESAHAGMKQDEARQKAQEIVKSITEATTTDPIQIQKVISLDKDSTNVDKIAFEIQEIIELGSMEKIQLDEQLDLIQSKLSTLPMTDVEQNPHLLMAALKSEVDHLRVTAENNVRNRTRSSLQIVESMNVKPSIKKHMKADIQSAQRAALKDLRQVYVKLYQTSKLMDELVNEDTTLPESQLET